MVRKRAVLCLLCGFLFGACVAGQPAAEIAQAEDTLRIFFQYLADGEYQKADALYGGGYETLQSMNPLVPPEDHDLLWQMGCTVNGLQCLPLLRVINSQQISEDEFLITVEFKGADGQAFVRGPCCGASEAEMPPVSQFEYQVARRNGRFQVLNPPVYVP